MIFPAVRPGPDHQHMAPKIINYLKENNFEHRPDKFGRKSAEFYRNYCRQDMSANNKPKLV